MPTGPIGLVVELELYLFRDQTLMQTLSAQVYRRLPDSYSLLRMQQLALPTTEHSKDCSWFLVVFVNVLWSWQPWKSETLTPLHLISLTLF